MGSLIMADRVKTQHSTAFPDGGQVRVLIILVLLVLLSIYLSEKNEENISRVLRACFVSVMFPVIPLYIAMVLLYWRKAKTFSMSDPQHWLGILFVLVFSMVFLDWKEAMGETKAAEKIFFDGLAIVVAFVLFRQLQLHRSEVEDQIKIARSRLPVAPGLALCFFRFIEGIVEGRPHWDSERRAMSYEEGRARYSMDHRLDAGHWISEKIVILFLESDLLSKDIRKLEKVRGETHVRRENLTLSSGNNINQELKRLIESSESTRDKVELFHYSENSIIRPTFSNHLKQIVERLKGGGPSIPSRLKEAVDEVVMTMKAQDDVMM